MNVRRDVCLKWIIYQRLSEERSCKAIMVEQKVPLRVSLSNRLLIIRFSAFRVSSFFKIIVVLRIIPRGRRLPLSLTGAFEVIMMTCMTAGWKMSLTSHCFTPSHLLWWIHFMHARIRKWIICSKANDSSILNNN